MHHATRIALSLVLPTLVLPGPDASASNVMRVALNIRVHDATRPQMALVDWALGRYKQANLQLPSLDIYFHEEVSGCRGYPGFFAPGRIDLCPGDLLNLIPRDNLLHEMAHAWSLLALTDVDRKAFMHLRGLANWNDLNRPWDRRGFEQVAEIIAWGIGDGVLLPSLPDNDEASLVAAYELLTGSVPPTTATAAS